MRDSQIPIALSVTMLAFMNGETRKTETSVPVNVAIKRYVRGVVESPPFLKEARFFRPHGEELRLSLPANRVEALLYHFHRA